MHHTESILNCSSRLSRSLMHNQPQHSSAKALRPHHEGQALHKGLQDNEKRLQSTLLCLKKNDVFEITFLQMLYESHSKDEICLSPGPSSFKEIDENVSWGL